MLSCGCITLRLKNFDFIFATDYQLIHSFSALSYYMELPLTAIWAAMSVLVARDASSIAQPGRELGSVTLNPPILWIIFIVYSFVNIIVIYVHVNREDLLVRWVDNLRSHVAHVPSLLCCSLSILHLLPFCWSLTIYLTVIRFWILWNAYCSFSNGDDDASSICQLLFLYWKILRVVW